MKQGELFSGDGYQVRMDASPPEGWDARPKASNSKWDAVRKAVKKLRRGGDPARIGPFESRNDARSASSVAYREAKRLGWKRKSALLVNPYDVDAVAETLRVATRMDRAEARTRMQRLGRTVRKETVFEWARDCLAMLEAF